MRGRRRNNVVRGNFRAAKSRWTGSEGYSAALPKKKSRSWLIFAPVWSCAALLGTAYGAGWLDNLTLSGRAHAAEASTGGERIDFRYCHIGGGYNCVVDGDTIWLKGVKIRIADIDAPETHDYRCSSEKELGDRATIRLHELLGSGSISLQSIDRDEDRYGRKLRLVLVNGTSVGDTLVSEGLARWYGNGRRPWC